MGLKNINKGIIKVADGLIVAPNFTFGQFKKTKFYKNQDGIKIIYLDGYQVIEKRKYLVSLFFRNGKIYILSLICCDEEYSERDEPKRKELHDKVLQEFGVFGNGKFGWGKIESAYDMRSNISSINIVYSASV